MSISTADRVELHELAARYCDIIDASDWPSLTSVFVGDATFDFRDIGFGVVEGVEAIRDQLVAFGGYAVAHLIANVWVADDEPVRLHSRVLTILPDKRVGWGSYVDDVVRTRDGWRVQRRVFTRGRDTRQPAVTRTPTTGTPAAVATAGPVQGDVKR